jgi:hypothetical protein
MKKDQAPDRRAKDQDQVKPDCGYRAKRIPPM